MKFRILGRTLLALAGAAVISLSLTSCSNNKTVGYVYVTATQYNQISELREDYNTGELHNISGTPIASGGANPIRAVVSSGSRFLYVLNAGTQSTPDASGAVTYQSANISIFSIGGFGGLSPQIQYASQGFGSRRLQLDSAGTHLYVLDEYEPVTAVAGGAFTTSIATAGNPNFPCLGTDGFYHPTGDITTFTVDTATGRLEPIQNQRDTTLTYFPVGCFPTDFRVTASYVYTMDAGSASNNDLQTVNVQAVSNGQLSPTQTAAIHVTPNNTSNISAINGDAAGKYIYLIDTTNDKLYLYTPGTNGALTAITGSPYDNSVNTSAQGPVQTLVDQSGKFLFVANAGPATGTNEPDSDIGVYNIDASTGYLDTPVQSSPFTLGTISGPVCIFEDTTNQFIYTAGSVDNSITGRKLDPNTGTLKPLNQASTFPVAGTPSWCVGISSTF
jgi:6-phosphogluconolactonase